MTRLRVFDLRHLDRDILYQRECDEVTRTDAVVDQDPVGTIVDEAVTIVTFIYHTQRPD